jgi:hypothetical protein
VTGENPGSYAITQGNLAAGTNYALTFIGNTLVITSAGAGTPPPQPQSPPADGLAPLYVSLAGVGTLPDGVASEPVAPSPSPGSLATLLLALAPPAAGGETVEGGTSGETTSAPMTTEELVNLLTGPDTQEAPNGSRLSCR